MEKIPLKSLSFLATDVEILANKNIFVTQLNIFVIYNMIQHPRRPIN